MGLRRYIDKKLTRYVTQRQGLEIQKTDYRDLEPEFLEIWDKSRHATMTPLIVGYGLYQAVRDVARRGLPGCFLECGVWRGGSSMIAAQTFLRYGSVRDLYLFDTYAGMSMPTEHDVSDYETTDSMDTWQKSQREDNVNEWCYAPKEEVQRNLLSTGYPAEHIHLIEGMVEDTLPGSDTGEISVLRLDTDWYDSTKAEMEILYPLLKDTGWLVLDDYGFWKGCRKAVDEYFDNKGNPPLLHRINFGSRMGMKIAPPGS